MEPPPHHHGSVASVSCQSAFCVAPITPRLVFSSQALLAVKSVPVDEDPETKVPEDGASQPGNSKVRGSPFGVH